MAFSPDGSILATGGGGTVRLWDVANRRQIGESLTGHTGRVTSVAFSPNGRTLVTATSSMSDEMTWLWDMATPHRPCRLSLRGSWTWTHVDAPGMGPIPAFRFQIPRGLSVTRWFRSRLPAATGGCTVNCWCSAFRLPHPRHGRFSRTQAPIQPRARLHHLGWLYQVAHRAPFRGVALRRGVSHQRNPGPLSTSS